MQIYVMQRKMMGSIIRRHKIQYPVHAASVHLIFMGIYGRKASIELPLDGRQHGEGIRKLVNRLAI